MVLGCSPKGTGYHPGSNAGCGNSVVFSGSGGKTDSSSNGKSYIKYCDDVFRYTADITHVSIHMYPTCGYIFGIHSQK